jgi:signal peptidase I
MPASKNEAQVVSGWMLLFEVVKVVAISLAIIIPVRYFLLQPFYVKGASMEPNFEDKEYLLIDEISYRVREPKRGEVVVFRYPRDESQFFIKRVIGLPGETISVHDDHIYINGALLDESKYLADTVLTSGTDEKTLGSDEYYLFGDNRPASLDSRIFGVVTRKEIVGKVWIRAWPFKRWKHFTAPIYPPLLTSFLTQPINYVTS